MVDPLDYRFGNDVTLRPGDSDRRPPVARIRARVEGTYLREEPHRQRVRLDSVQGQELLRRGVVDTYDIKETE